MLRNSFHWKQWFFCNLVYNVLNSVYQKLSVWSPRWKRISKFQCGIFELMICFWLYSNIPPVLRAFVVVTIFYISLYSYQSYLCKCLLVSLLNCFPNHLKLWSYSTVYNRSHKYIWCIFRFFKGMQIAVVGVPQYWHDWWKREGIKFVFNRITE